MPSKYPILKPKEIIKTLERFGFVFISQKGSHMIYSNNDRIVIIPNHIEIVRGTLKSILNQANIELNDFLDKLK